MGGRRPIAPLPPHAPRFRVQAERRTDPSGLRMLLLLRYQGPPTPLSLPLSFIRHSRPGVGVGGQTVGGCLSGGVTISS